MPVRPPIHHAIKTTLGYSQDEPDAQVRKDWRERTSRVCKPCWELKYCPYGPFVEQSPLLPLAMSDTLEHREHLKKCLETGVQGELEELTPERRAELESWLGDRELLVAQTASEMRRRRLQRAAAKKKRNPIEELGGALPPIEQYRVRYDQNGAYPKSINDFPKRLRKQARKVLNEIKLGYRNSLRKGWEDNRKPLSKWQITHFKKELAKPLPDLPDRIPEEFQIASCNVFGHICPVFFTAESFTETEAQRRIGRYGILPSTRMRIVRRDNYTCQECAKHLLDDEVEFDHIIPLSRGGSSDEHNLRLTCFDCNRDKSDSFSPLSIADRVRASKGRRVKGRGTRAR